MDTPAGHDLNADQIAYWNGPAGQRWTDRQASQDVLLAPVSEILIDRAAVTVGERIFDVGCGCGALVAHRQSLQTDSPRWTWLIAAAWSALKYTNT